MSTQNYRHDWLIELLAWWEGTLQLGAYRHYPHIVITRLDRVIHSLAHPPPNPQHPLHQFTRPTQQ